MDMSSDLDMLRRGLDDALRSAREAGSRRFDWLIRRRVVIVPRPIARLLPRFAAGVCLSIVFIDPRLAGAPPPAIRYLMAHEWGHVDRGHIPCAFVALAAALSRVALASSPQSLGTNIAELLILLVTGLLLFGKSVIRRELEADAFAAGIVGRAQAADSLAWLVEWRGKGWPRDLRTRYDALGSISVDPAPQHG